MSSYPVEKPASPDSLSLTDQNKATDVAKLEGGHGINHILTAGQDGFNQHRPSAEELAETKRIMRKMDWRVLPIASILYLFSFLDRSAIGNAKIAGLVKELGLNPQQYNASVSIFFALYCLLEVPSNLMLKRYGAKLWLPLIVILWGLTMTFMGLVKNFAGLFAMRLLLGGFEAGLFPGISYYLTTLYPRRAIQTRIALFFSAATIAGAFGGLLAYGLSKVTTGDYQGWSWIFITEGILTVVVGIASYWLLFSGFEDAKFLTEDEKVFMKERIIYDSTDVPMDDSYKFEYVKAGLLDWKTWLSIAAYICCLAPLYSIALTLPTILRTSLGYDAVKAQLLTVPVYCVSAVFVVIFAWFSDRYHNRSIPFMVGCSISAIGWAMGIATTKPNVRFAGCFLSAFSYPAFPSIVALLSQNVGGKTKRSVTIAVQVGIGGLSGIISSNIFLTKEAPHFMTAYHLNLYFNLAAISICALNWYLLVRANARKQRLIASGEAAKIPREKLAAMGDESPFFQYKY